MDTGVRQAGLLGQRQSIHVCSYANVLAGAYRQAAYHTGLTNAFGYAEPPGP